MSKKITAMMLVLVLLAASLSMAGCSTGCTSAAIDLTGDLVLGADEEKVISCTSEDPQAVKIHSLSEQLFADGWEACGENDNFLMSPLSLIEVLGMVSEGAEGETRRQLENFFGYSTNALSQHMRYLENNLPSSDEAKLEIANSIWIRDSEALQVKDDFLKAIRKFMEMRTLTPVILRELIEKIEVFPVEGTGKNKTQKVIIHYRFVGTLDIPGIIHRPSYILDSRKGVAIEYLSNAV